MNTGGVGEDVVLHQPHVAVIRRVVDVVFADETRLQHTRVTRSRNRRTMQR